MAQAKGLRILSIDDSKAVHAFMKQCFAGTPHTLSTMLLPKEALQKLKDSSSDFDLVLLDWEMPELSGPELLEQARAAGIKIPIIMVTTKNDPDGIMQMLEKGAQEFIMKPFTTDIIFEKIGSVLGVDLGMDGKGSQSGES